MKFNVDPLVPKENLAPHVHISSSSGINVTKKVKLLKMLMKSKISFPQFLQNFDIEKSFLAQ